MRPTGLDPDPTLTLFIAALVFTALGYAILVLPILVIQSHSRHGIRTVMPLTILGPAVPESWIYFSTG